MGDMFSPDAPTSLRQNKSELGLREHLRASDMSLADALALVHIIAFGYKK